jgi:hypothetical protein
MDGMIQTEAEPATGAPSQSRWIFAGLFGLGLALVGLLYVLPRPTALHLLDERGPMEMVSLSVYALDVVLLLWMFPRRSAVAGWAVVGLLLLAVAEYNPRNVLTNLIEARPSNPGDPVGVQPLGVLAVSLIVLGILAGLVYSGRHRFWFGLRQGAPEIWLAVVGTAFLPVSFFIDRIQGSRFNWFSGHRMNTGIFYASDVIEETLEFLMPFFFFFAILLWSRRRKIAPRETAS